MKTGILVILSAVSFASPVLAQETALDVGVVPLRGNVDPSVLGRGSVILSNAVAGMEGLRVISLSGLSKVFGSATQARLDACKDDPCFVEATRQIRTDRIIVGTLDDEGQALTLRLRLLTTSTSGTPLVRVTKDVGSEEGALAIAVTSAATELFPAEAQSSFGTLVLDGGMAGAQIYIDGSLAAEMALDAPSNPTTVLKVRPGKHQVRVVASGHFPQSAGAKVLVGQKTELSISLQKNRSNSPLILGGLGLLALGTATVFGLVTNGTVGDWEEGCPPSKQCAVGYTKQRYDDDAGAVSRGRFTSNGLLVVGGVALVGAAVWYLLDPGVDPEVP